jgi:thiosulfate/3-mercaptopyruvate sulfurtransferase
MSPLISVEELREELGQVTLLDVRYATDGPKGAGEYRRGHLPAAVYVDLDRDLAGLPGAGGRHPLPEPAAFEQAMRRVGVSRDRPVVVHDDWGGRAAARAWWLLRFFGHPDVRVLDGGVGAWTAAGGRLETGEVSPEPGDFVAQPGQLPVVDADDVLRVGVLVDARAPERYRGEVEPLDPVAGHIPGAVNVPTTSNLSPEGRFRPPAELAETYRSAGAVAGADVAVYCGSGVTAAHDVLALELAGVRAALYPGSWSEWVADPTRPVATTD